MIPGRVVLFMSVHGLFLLLAFFTFSLGVDRRGRVCGGMMGVDT